MSDAQIQKALEKFLMPVFVKALKQVQGEFAGAMANEVREKHNDALLPPMDALISVQEIKRVLGRNGVPMAHSTFVKHFIDTNRLVYVDNPSDRRGKYVSAIQWASIQGAQPLKVISIKRVA